MRWGCKQAKKVLGGSWTRCTGRAARGRPSSTSWRAEGGGARGERGRVPGRSVSSETEDARGGLAGGAARARRMADAGDERLRHSEKQRGERRDGGEGKTVIRSKFKIHFVNSNFSPSTWPQMKNF